jgi:hypothetical protein
VYRICNDVRRDVHDFDGSGSVCVLVVGDDPPGVNHTWKPAGRAQGLTDEAVDSAAPTEVTYDEGRTEDGPEAPKELLESQGETDVDVCALVECLCLLAARRIQVAGRFVANFCPRLWYT